jgi:hypothetical protein
VYGTTAKARFPTTYMLEAHPGPKLLMSRSWLVELTAFSDAAAAFAGKTCSRLFDLDGLK